MLSPYGLAKRISLLHALAHGFSSPLDTICRLRMYDTRGEIYRHDVATCPSPLKSNAINYNISPDFFANSTVLSPFVTVCWSEYSSEECVDCYRAAKMIDCLQQAATKGLRHTGTLGLGWRSDSGAGSCSSRTSAWRKPRNGFIIALLHHPSRTPRSALRPVEIQHHRRRPHL